MCRATREIAMDTREARKSDKPIHWASDESIIFKYFSALIVLISVGWVARSLASGSFSLRFIPLHLVLWGIASVIWTSSADVEVNSEQMRFRTFRKWESVPLRAIQKVSYYRIGVCVVGVSLDKKLRRIMFRPSFDLSSKSPPWIVHYLSSCIGMQPNKLIEVPTHEQCANLPLVGRALTVSKTLLVVFSLISFGFAVARFFVEMSAQANGNGRSGPPWVYFYNEALFILMLILSVKSLIRRWNREIGTRDLETKADAIRVAAIFGFLIGNFIAWSGIYASGAPFPLLVTQKGMFLAMLLFILFVGLLAKMAHHITDTYQDILREGKIGLKQFLQFKEVYRTLYPDSFLDVFLNISLISGFLFTGIWAILIFG